MMNIEICSDNCMIAELRRWDGCLRLHFGSDGCSRPLKAFDGCSRPLKALDGYKKHGRVARPVSSN